MPHPTATRLLAVLLPALLTLLPSPAHAEKVVTRDAAGDAGVVGWLAEEDAELPPVPDATPVDIVRTVAAHGDRRLAVAVHFDDLAGARRHSTRLVVRTPAGRFEVRVQAKRGRVTRTMLTHREESLDCAALRARFDVAVDVVGVSVPTACLVSPRWVQVGVIAAAPLPMTDPAVLASVVDDGQSDDFRLFRVAMGPRIHRG